MKQADPWTENLRHLGLPPAADWEAVQARYRRLVLSLHPDVNPTRVAAERFRQVAAAYERLLALRRERKARSEEELIRMAEDPKIASLPTEELTMRLRYSSSPRVRAAAAWLLARSPGRETRRLLLSAAADPDDLVRGAALEALGAVGRAADLPRLFPLACTARGPAGQAGRRCLIRIVKRTLSGRTSAGRPFGRPFACGERG